MELFEYLLHRLMSSSSIDIAGASQFYCRNIVSLLAILPLHCCTFTKQLHLKVVLAHQTFVDFVRAQGTRTAEFG